MPAKLPSKAKDGPREDMSTVLARIGGGHVPKIQKRGK